MAASVGSYEFVETVFFLGAEQRRWSEIGGIGELEEFYVCWNDQAAIWTQYRRFMSLDGTRKVQYVQYLILA